jgi:hypothetical protein
MNKESKPQEIQEAGSSASFFFEMPLNDAMLCESL